MLEEDDVADAQKGKARNGATTHEASSSSTARPPPQQQEQRQREKTDKDSLDGSSSEGEEDAEELTSFEKAAQEHQKMMARNGIEDLANRVRRRSFGGGTDTFTGQTTQQEANAAQNNLWSRKSLSFHTASDGLRSTAAGALGGSQAGRRGSVGSAGGDLSSLKRPGALRAQIQGGVFPRWVLH